MERELEIHPDQALFDQTFKSFVQRHDKNPIRGYLALLFVAGLVAGGGMYAGQDNHPERIGPVIGLEILVLFAFACLFANTCKKAIGRSKWMQQKHLKKQVLRKKLH